MKRLLWLAAPLLCLAISLAFEPGLLGSYVTAGGLSTNLGEVVIEGLGTGEKYSLKALGNVTLSVVNRGEDSVLVRMTPLVPDSVELRRSAEPIPSADWISLEVDSLVLGPGQMGIADVFIDIPADSSLRGRRFQVMIWSRNIPGPGVFIACGLKSRVIFSIADELPAETDQYSGDAEPDDKTDHKTDNRAKGRIHNPEQKG